MPVEQKQNSNSLPEIQEKITNTGWNIKAEQRIAAALSLAERGFYLFPVKFVQENGKLTKKPAVKGWQHAATTDPDQLRKWFENTRKSIGVYAEASGLVVVDTDQKHGIDGEANFIELAGGIAPDTFTVETPTGSRHYYFRGDPVKSTASVVAPGVDIKSRGGFVVGPGSTSPQGQYRVVNDVPIRPIPTWLVETIGRAYTAAAPVAKLTSAVELDTDAALTDARSYLAEAPASVEFQGGNDNAYRVACQLKDRGISEPVALDMMADLDGWNGRCLPAWPVEELEPIVASAYKHGQNSPGSASAAADFEPHPEWDPERDAIGAANDNPAPVEKRPVSGIIASPFVWRDPATIPPREWLYGRHYIRRYATGIIAPGGTGKTSLVQTEALSMATGRDLIGGNESQTALNVWIWNLEDPVEEVERRFAAAVAHHDVDPATLAGRLFVNSGRDTPLVIATKAKDKLTIAEPVIDELVAAIRANGIDVLIVDPFVSSHRLPENDNAAMDAAVKAWARVAHLGNCAVELVHHSRKLGGEAVSAESARGGSAFVDGCRGVRVINRMSEDDAAKLGITEPRRFFYVADDKPNMAPPPAGKRDWYQLVSVELPNGDNVGAVDRYTPADPLDDVTATDLELVQKRFAEGGHRYDEQSTEWGGYAVAEILGLDVGVGGKASRTPEQNAARAKVKDILRKWRAAGDVSVVTGKDGQRKTKSFYASGEGATAGQDRLAA